MKDEVPQELYGIMEEVVNQFTSYRIQLENLHLAFEDAIHNLVGSLNGNRFSLEIFNAKCFDWFDESIKILDLRNRLSLIDIHNLRGTNIFLLCDLLEELDLSKNNLHGLPPQIGVFFKLRKFNVEHNQIEVIPDFTFRQFKELTEFRAGHNRLKALSESSIMFINLEILSVSNNIIDKLPDWIGSLTKLRELDVRFNNIESMSEDVCGIQSLVKLNISNNHLESLPESIGRLTMLQKLDIRQNQIQILPDSFSLLIRLRILLVDSCPLQVPPKDFVMNEDAQEVILYMRNICMRKRHDKQLLPRLKAN